MAQIKINIPGYKELNGDAPIVILGPNGSGKTQLAQKFAGSNQVSPISAQRRTWVNDNLPVQEERQLHNETISQINQWRQN
jgi:adenylate kinase family enzyme